MPLRPLKRAEMIEWWEDNQTNPGEDWDQVIHMLAYAETDPNIHVNDDSHESLFLAVSMFHHFSYNVCFGKRHVCGGIPDEVAQ